MKYYISIEIPSKQHKSLAVAKFITTIQVIAMLLPFKVKIEKISY